MSELPLEDLQHLSTLADIPNPKPNLSDKQGYGTLASLYTAFSNEFAHHLLSKLVEQGKTKVLDPFGGMGTVGEAGRSLPIEVMLNDINPFATMSGLYRTSSADDLQAALERVRRIELQASGQLERDVFLAAIEDRLGAGHDLISLMNGTITQSVRDKLLDVHLLSLLRIATHRRYRGSNPTWTKKSENEPLSAAILADARDSVFTRADIYHSKLLKLNADFRSNYSCGNVLSIDVAEESFDAILTSPPYPNRTDYIRHYLPAAELLIGGEQELERALREDQIGTPLIRGDLISAKLPQSVLDLIDRVRVHPSYASEAYYVKGFQYYFSDMQSALKKFHKWLRVGGDAIIVVQDAYYKEMRIPVADLLIDMAAEIGLSLCERKDFSVPRALSNLSAKSRETAPKKKVMETCILLRKR